VDHRPRPCGPCGWQQFSAGTRVFALSKHPDAVDSMHFTATTMATVGYP
jgi:hypothetical protein